MPARALIAEALLPIPAAYGGYMGGTSPMGDFVAEPKENVIEADHSELGVRQDRWRWARGAPDTIFWTDGTSDWGGSLEGSVAEWLQRKTGHPITRHRYYPGGYSTWRSRVQAAVRPTEESLARRLIEAIYGEPSGLYRAPDNRDHEYIVSAAVQSKMSGDIYLGDGHAEALDAAAVAGQEIYGSHRAGFLTSEGRFVTRAEALIMARAREQMPKGVPERATVLATLMKGAQTQAPFDPGVRYGLDSTDVRVRESAGSSPARRVIESALPDGQPFLHFGGGGEDWTGYWLDPEGKFHEVESMQHDEWAAEFTGLDAAQGFTGTWKLNSLGWCRVVAETTRQGTRTLNCSSDRWNKVQRNAAEMVAIQQSATLIKDGVKRPLYEPPVMESP